MTRIPWRWLLAMSVAGSLLVGGYAHAQDLDDSDRCREEQQSEDAKQGKNYRTVIGPDGRKVFVIEKAFVVCGKVPKPQVIYVLHASTINYEWATLKQDFLPKVLNTVKKTPF